MDFSEFIGLLQEIFKVALSYFVSPSKRVFWLYLITSAIIAFVIFKASKTKGNFINYLFNRKVWLSTSAITDYLLILFNAIVKVVVLAPFFGFALYIAKSTEHFFVSKYGIVDTGFTNFQLILIYTILIVVLNDFITFILHYLMHKIPFLWEFHKVHHSARRLNPFTQYRIHPIELIINNLGEVFSKGILTGLFLFLAAGKISIITFLGVNILNFLFYFFGANLRHSHVKFKYFNFLEHILISPFQHQIHHSNNPAHYDTNLGSRFAFWDWMFGTLLTSKNVDKIGFGLGREEDNAYNTFSKNLITPFKNLPKAFFKKNT
ncbi:MAG: sterol desaturase family protein [Flavobacteriales bacterium]|nr:sterol desaturase family protein [Flavobacteriales bacterium]